MIAINVERYKDLSRDLEEMALMVRVFLGCMEVGLCPAKDSPCHKKAKELVDKHPAR